MYIRNGTMNSRVAAISHFVSGDVLMLLDVAVRAVGSIPVAAVPYDAQYDYKKWRPCREGGNGGHFAAECHGQVGALRLTQHPTLRR